MFFHFFQHLSIKDNLFQFFKYISLFGQTGVSLFFVLSGFLITRILLSNKNSEKYFSHFYIRRALRIFPLYYLYLLFFYLLLPPLFNLPFTPFSAQFYYWIYIQNISLTFNLNGSGPEHFWSLAVEEHFYLFWPIIIYCFNNKNILRSIGLLIIIAFGVRILLTYMHFNSFYFTFSRMDELSLGALMALMELKNMFKTSNNRVYLISLLLAIFPTLYLWLAFGGFSYSYIQVIKISLISIVYFLFLGYIISKNDRSGFKKILLSPFMSYTGKISFGLYVYHPTCFLIIIYKLSSGNYLLDFLISFASAYLIASISYFFFESKILKLKEKFSN